MKKFVSITISDSRYLDKHIPDLSGDKIIEILSNSKLILHEKIIIPDEKKHISNALQCYLNQNDVNFIVTTGGTGISKRDITPDITNKFIEKNINGIPEMIRLQSYKKLKTSLLYRGLCGIANDKLILNLPGSPGGVEDGLEIIVPILDHIFSMISGDTKH
tara:strand:+ start:2509 stop:2991 length:483 start_codon:yes stop_codon:yes gene_type:complete